VVKVPPKIAKANFWLSVMKPARKEATFRVHIIVGDIYRYTLEYRITHRGDDEDDSCPAIDKILGVEILRFVRGSFTTFHGDVKRTILPSSSL